MHKLLHNDSSLSLSIRYIPLADLKPSPHNARVHPSMQVKALMKSIDTFGFLIPILVGPENTVIAGHGRIEAAKQLRVGSVPTISIDHLTPAQQRAYRIADNRLTELAEWDTHALGKEFAYLMTVPDLDMTLTGFEIPRIDLLIQGTQEESEEPEDESVLEVKPIVVTEIGDCWVLEDHLIFCGNSLEEESYECLLEGEIAQQVITDPPYNVRINNHVCGSGTRDGSKVLVGSSASGKNMQLIKAITRSFLWNEQLLSGEKRTVRDLGLQENIKAPSYVTKVMHLRFLAPDIIESILDGTHPADWTVEKLFAINSTNWPEQRTALDLN